MLNQLSHLGAPSSPLLKLHKRVRKKLQFEKWLNHSTKTQTQQQRGGEGLGTLENEVWIGYCKTEHKMNHSDTSLSLLLTWARVSQATCM